MKFATIVSNLPLFTQVSVLYPVLGSLNASAINGATRLVADDVRHLENASRATKNSIDKYNELVAELRGEELSDEHARANGFTPSSEKPKQLDTILKVRTPLLSIFNTAQSKMPNRDGDPADFSFTETLARQLAREYNVQDLALTAQMQACIDAGAVTAEEIKTSDLARFAKEQDFKKEFKHLILDKLHEREDFEASIEEADIAFNELGEEYQHRMLKRMLPKLNDALMQNLGRRSFDEDSGTNVMIIGLAIKEIKGILGDSEADVKLKAMQEALAA